MYLCFGDVLYWLHYFRANIQRQTMTFNRHTLHENSYWIILLPAIYDHNEP